MSTIDLIILGILQKQPLNAMEIAKYITNNGVDKLVKISSPAVYKSCKRMFKADKLDGKVVKEGEMPEKVIYSVNKKGQEYFLELMSNYSGEVKPFYLEFNSFIWNIDNLNPKEAKFMLLKLQSHIIQLKDWVIEHENEFNRSTSSKKTFASRAIIKQYRMVLNTLTIWIKETIDEL